MPETAPTPEPAIYCCQCPYDPADAKSFRRKPAQTLGWWLNRIAAAVNRPRRMSGGRAHLPSSIIIAT